MFIENVVRKVLGGHVRTGLLPIRQSEGYYQFLESRFFEQGNPFRKLLLDTGPDMKAIAFVNPESNK